MAEENKSFFKSFFQDDNGVASCSRLMAFMIVFVFLMVWVISCILKSDFLPWEQGHVFGLLSGTAPKVIQTFSEKGIIKVSKGGGNGNS